jgi:hypothetical protein
MKIVQAPRASAILYNLLSGCRGKGSFLLPANICPIVPMTFFKAKVSFEFIDISVKTLHMDLDKAHELIKSRKVGGILYAHTYGDPFTPGDFFTEIKEQYPDVLIIDDRCLCVPDLVPDPTSEADATLYSTGYGKIVDEVRSGYAYLREDLLYSLHQLPFQNRDLVELEKNYKRSIEASETYFYNDSNWLQMEMELPAFPEFIKLVDDATERSITHRRSINAVYNSLIPSDLCLGEPYQLWRFSVRLPDNKKTLGAIFDAHLFASSHYASLAGIMGEGDCPVARHLAGEVVNLFNDHHYTLEMAERTAQIVLRSI